MTKQALVTGGAGFIGGHVAENLLVSGYNVRVFDNFSTGDASNLDAIADDVEISEGDLRDLGAVTAAVSGCDLVVHLGALGSVPRSVADPLTTHEVNATGTLNTLLACRDQSVGRMIFSSSSSVFGTNRNLPKTEDMLGNPLSPYAASKRIGEDYCRQFFALYDFDVVIARFFNVFGPRQRADHVYAAVIPIFVDAILNGRPVQIHGDGLQSRDFTYVDNVVDGLHLIAESTDPRIAGKALHLACGASTSLLDILDHIESVLGVDIAREFTESRPGDVKDSLASIDLIRDLTGYHPQVDVMAGVQKTIEWFRTQQS